MDEKTRAEPSLFHLHRIHYSDNQELAESIKPPESRKKINQERRKKMLFQVGGQGTRPTFFEMAAAQQLPSSLRAAVTYSLGVINFLN